MGRQVKRMIAAAVALAGVVALGGVYAAAQSKDGAELTAFEIPRASDEDLELVAQSKVFFAHQSVGSNILDGLPRLYGERAVAAPAVNQGTSIAPGFTHINVGVNGDPLGKIEAFDEAIRSGVGEDIDVAILKLCYVDIQADADVEQVFSAYRDTFAALQRDYPDVVFVPATVPVTAERRIDQKVRALLGRQDGLGPEQNEARYRFNSLIRAEYAASGRLFDIAAIESTTPDGRRVSTGGPATTEALHRGYASDPGHLNTDGGTIAAEALAATLARALS